MRLRRAKRWINRRLQLAGFAPLFLSACSQCTPLPPPDIEPIPEPVAVTSSETATVSATSTSTTGAPDVVPVSCETACANQRALSCEIGQPTPEGHDCVVVCQNLEDGPIASVRWDLECLTEAASCDGC